MSMGKFGPAASNFGYEFWAFILGKIRALVWKHLQSLIKFDLPIILGVKFWWFSFFFTSSLGPLEPELAQFKDLEEIGDIWEMSGKSEISRKSMRNEWEISGNQRHFEWDFQNVANFFLVIKRS